MCSTGSLLRILLPHIQRDQEPTNSIVRRDRRRDLHDLPIRELPLQPLEHKLRHPYIQRHGIRVREHGRVLIVQRTLAGRGVRRRFEDVLHALGGYSGSGIVAEERRVVVPLVPGFVQDGDAADGDFADGGWKRGLGADCAEEGVPEGILATGSFESCMPRKCP